MEWRPGVVESIGYYVYLLVDPRDERVFYVGKGTGSRCFSHVREAKTTTRDSKGDYEKLTTIRRIEQDGHDVRIEILRHTLTEEEAFHLEAASMDLLGFSDLTNRVVGHGTRERGRMTVDDVNAQYGARPVEFDPEHRVILIRSQGSFTGWTRTPCMRPRGCGGGSHFAREGVPSTRWRCTEVWSEPRTQSTVGLNRRKMT